MVLHAQFALAAFLTGLIWVVQIVIYPLFARLGKADFAPYHAAYTRRIGYVVAPAMVAEALLAAAFVLPRPTAAAAWGGLALVGVIWGSTALVQVPLHRRLEQHGPEPRALAALVRTNWVRTAAWTARTGLLLWLVRAGAPAV